MPQKPRTGKINSNRVQNEKFSVGSAVCGAVLIMHGGNEMMTVAAFRRVSPGAVYLADDPWWTVQYRVLWTLIEGNIKNEMSSCRDDLLTTDQRRITTIHVCKQKSSVLQWLMFLSKARPYAYVTPYARYSKKLRTHTAGVRLKCIGPMGFGVGRMHVALKKMILLNRSRTHSFRLFL